MKDKHIEIEQDTLLLHKIYTAVEDGIKIDSRIFTSKIVLKFGFYFSVVFFSYLTIYVVEIRWVFLLNFVFYGIISMLFAFNFSHDFAHNTIFKSTKLNNQCFRFIYSLMGAHAESWKKRHINSHHFAPNVENYDSDLKITKLIRVIPKSEFHWYHRYQHLYAPFAYTTYSLFWIFIKDFVILFEKISIDEKKDIKYHISFWSQKVFYVCIIIVLPMVYAKQDWQMVLLGFLLMHLTQSLFLLFTFFMTHHVESTVYPTADEKGIINTSWLMNQIKSSNDMHPFSKTANFILGGFNNHIAHHLFPNYHHIYYPQLNRILYKVLRDTNIEPNQTTYLGGIASHLRLLKRMSVIENDQFLSKAIC